MNNDKCCRPVSKSKTSDIKMVKDHLDVDWRVTMHGVCSELDMGFLTVHWILKDELHMIRVSAYLVLRLLKNHEMERCTASQGAYFEKN